MGAIFIQAKMLLNLVRVTRQQQHAGAFNTVSIQAMKAARPQA